MFFLSFHFVLYLLSFICFSVFVPFCIWFVHLFCVFVLVFSCFLLVSVFSDLSAVVELNKTYIQILDHYISFPNIVNIM